MTNMYVFRDVIYVSFNMYATYIHLGIYVLLTVNHSRFRGTMDSAEAADNYVIMGSVKQGFSRCLL